MSAYGVFDWDFGFPSHEWSCSSWQKWGGVLGRARSSRSGNTEQSVESISHSNNHRIFDPLGAGCGVFGQVYRWREGHDEKGLMVERRTR